MVKQEVRRHIFNDIDKDVIPDVFESGHFQNKDRVFRGNNCIPRNCGIMEIAGNMKRDG